MMLTGKQKFQQTTKQDGVTLLTQKFAGKRVFLAGHPSTLAGQCFSGFVTGGCSIE